MEKGKVRRAIRVICWRVGKFMRRCIFRILSFGPIPTHIAFIMDGNRRYAKKWNLIQQAGHRAGFLALMCMLIYCCELNVKYLTVFVFSMDNFKRKPDEVESIMKLLGEKIELLIREDSLLHYYKAKVHFSGNLELLNKSVRNEAKRLMVATAGYSAITFTLCVAYSSTDEIKHAIQELSKEKRDDIFAICEADNHPKRLINVVDIERKMYMGIAPYPDLLIRTSGESRLSNFLLWQSTCSLLATSSLSLARIQFSASDLGNLEVPT